MSSNDDGQSNTPEKTPQTFLWKGRPGSTQNPAFQNSTQNSTLFLRNILAGLQKISQAHQPMQVSPHAKLKS